MKVSSSFYNLAGVEIGLGSCWKDPTYLGITKGMIHSNDGVSFTAEFQARFNLSILAGLTTKCSRRPKQCVLSAVFYVILKMDFHAVCHLLLGIYSLELLWEFKMLRSSSQSYSISIIWLAITTTSTFCAISAVNECIFKIEHVLQFFNNFFMKRFTTPWKVNLVIINIK